MEKSSKVLSGARQMTANWLGLVVGGEINGVLILET